jgi:hypothetical protein
MLHPKQERLPIPKLEEEEREIKPLELSRIKSVYVKPQEKNDEK